MARARFRYPATRMDIRKLRNATLASRAMRLTYGAFDRHGAIVHRFPCRNYPGNAKIRNHKQLSEVF